MKVIVFAIATVLFLAYSCWAWERYYEVEACLSGFLFLVCFVVVLRESQHRRCD